MKLVCKNYRCDERDKCHHSSPHEWRSLCLNESCERADNKGHSEVYCEKVEEGFDPEEIINKAFGGANV